MHTAATTRVGASVRAFALSVGLAAMLGGAAPGVSAELKDPLSQLASAGGSILCFGRDYSPDHLARHPKQMTRRVVLAFQQGFVDVVLTSRRGAPKRIGAGCRYVSHQSGHRTFPGVRVVATTVACSIVFRRRSPSRSSARWTSHGSSLIWA